MNKIKGMLISALLLLSLLAIISPVSAATYHVYSGDDIESIIQGASSGDTIYVHAGYYNSGQISINGDNITIIGDGPSNTIIDISSGDGIAASSRDYITVKNITVKDATSDGIDLRNYGTIENCIIYNSGDNGIEVDDHCTIKNCLSYDNEGDGFYDDEYCTYINCTSANNGDDGFADNRGGTKVINCIAFGNDTDGFDIDNNSGSGQTCEIKYSNAWNSGGDDYDETPAGTGSISVDPKFVDGIITFYLSIGSPCADSGSDSSSAIGLYNGFTTRTDGTWDKGRVDMGFHYASNRGPPSGLPMAKILEIVKENQED